MMQSLLQICIIVFYQDLTRKRNRDSESDDGECVDESEDIDTEMQNEDGESDAELDIKRCRFEVGELMNSQIGIDCFKRNRCCEGLKYHNALRRVLQTKQR